MKKCILSLALLDCTTARLFATGSSEQPAATQTKKAETVVAATPTKDGPMQLPIVDKPTEFTIFLNFNNMPFDPEWPVWKEMAKRTGISLKSVISKSNSNEKEAFNLMLSSGKLADVIG